MPINHPVRLIVARVAGAPQIMMEKYCEAWVWTASLGEMAASSSHLMGDCSATMAMPSSSASATERNSITDICRLSRAPYACAVSPLVPMRRNPKFQYVRLNIVAPTETAPIVTASPMWPAMVRSTSPSSGTMTFDRIAGTAILRMLLFTVGVAVYIYEKRYRLENQPIH